MMILLRPVMRRSARRTGWAAAFRTFYGVCSRVDLIIDALNGGKVTTAALIERHQSRSANTDQGVMFLEPDGSSLGGWILTAPPLQAHPQLW